MGGIISLNRQVESGAFTNAGSAARLSGYFETRIKLQMYDSDEAKNYKIVILININGQSAGRDPLERF